MGEFVEACRLASGELAATGADLSAYNSTENAADFADLRKVLGITTWNVYGTSYGSYLAQTLMRGHPEGIRSVVLDSVLPTTYTIPGNWWITRAGFDNLFQACAAETACNAAQPHLEKTFTGLVNKLEAEPLTTTVADPATGKDLKVVLDGGALIDWLRNQNYAVPLLRAAPDLIGGLAAGRPEAIEAIAKDRASRAPPPGPGVPALGYGLSYGVTCREDYPFASPEDLAAAGREAFPDYPASVQVEGVGGWAYANEDCHDVWKVPPAPKAMRQPVTSSIPTLLISGSFDTLTSLAGAQAAAANLSNATIISIPGVGHVVSPASPCAQAVIVSFLADPHAPDTSCVGALKPFPRLHPHGPRREPLRRFTACVSPCVGLDLPPLGGWGQIVEADEFRQAGRHIDGEPLHGFSRCRRWPSRQAILPSLPVKASSVIACAWCCRPSATVARTPDDAGHPASRRLCLCAPLRLDGSKHLALDNPPRI